MTRKRLYPYCEDSDIPSVEVVKKFSKPNRAVAVVGPSDNVETDDWNSGMGADETFYRECEELFKVKKDWTAVLACMNID